MSELLAGEVFRQVMSDLQIGVYFTNLERRIVFWNAGAERITGYLTHEVIGRCCRENILIHCDHQQRPVCAACCPLAEAMADGKAREASLFLQHKSGHRIPIRIHSMPIRDTKGTIIGAAETFQRQRDVPHPERREIGSSAGFFIGGLPDYSFMISELRLRLARLDEGSAPFGLVCAKVDDFDGLRTRRGHEACETVLRVIVSTLQNTTRPGDCLGMWSDSRLMLLVEAATPEHTRRVAQRMSALVACSNVLWWGDPVQITISCGATIANTSDTMESVLSRTEHALQTSVAQGGGRVTFVQE